MKVLGLRVAPSMTRYALLKYDGKVCALLNSNTESRLVYPADANRPDEKVHWLYRELQRLFHDHPDTAKVCIKTNEYTQQDTKSKRESAYLEGAVLLFCRQANVPVTLTIYASLSTKGATVKSHAEERVGRTEKYWNKQVADAIVAAWNGASS